MKLRGPNMRNVGSGLCHLSLNQCAAIELKCCDCAWMLHLCRPRLLTLVAAVALVLYFVRLDQQDEFRLFVLAAMDTV